jgi:hypothetical protein
MLIVPESLAMEAVFELNAAITPGEAARNAIAQQHLEGLHPSEALMRDLHQVATGLLPLAKAIDNIGKRLEHVQIRRP